ncbi:hypothetical protein JCM10213_006646 [Rhodosporidiobolus nylandii]
MPDAAAERTALLHEIAQLEQEIARFADASLDLATKQTGSANKRARVAGTTWGDAGELDEAIRAQLHTAGGALVGDRTSGPIDEDDAAEPAKRLKQAEQLIRDNSQLTGIDFISTLDEVLSRDDHSLLRRHTLSGTLSTSTSPLGFTVRLYVREPGDALEQAQKAKRDPGREFVVERMEAEVKGGGAELRETLSRLQLDKHPNPPAFFALLRQYSLLFSSRTKLFTSLLQDFPHLAASPPNNPTELVFSASGFGPSLTLAYSLSPSAAPTAIRLSRPLDPHLSLTATVPPAAPSAVRATFEAIPEQFQRMLDDGFEPEKAVGAVVKAVFGAQGV